MNNEHNPIALLVNQIQDEYLKKVSPNEEIALVRYIIKPDQSKLYEGFLKLESTPHGRLPEVPIVLLTPFEDIETHSKSLIKDWIESFKKDKKLAAEIEAGNLQFDWDISVYEQKLESIYGSADALLLEMLRTFQAALPTPRLPIVLSLFPYSIAGPKEYQRWLDKVLSLKFPKKIRIMFFDFAEERHFDHIMKDYYPYSISLSVSLDLEGAISKLAKSGNPNDPEIKFRECMMEMSKGASKNNLQHVHDWGRKGLKVTQKTGIKSAYATAHVIYAGMLFNFKDYEAIENLLQKGLAIGKQGLAGGDETCKPIIIQTYGYQASCQQLQKKKEKAADLFCKQAEEAVEYQLDPIALSAWWLAYSAIKKKDKHRYNSLVEKAYNHGETIAPELLKATCMRFIAADFYAISEGNGDIDKRISINAFMIQVEGENWLNDAEGHRKKMEKKNIPILNWF